MNIAEVKSNKGCWNNVFVDGYKFNHQKVIKDNHYFVCANYSNKNCKCRLIKTKTGEYKVNGTHNHTPNPTELPRAQILDSLKEKSKSDRASARVLIADAVGTVNSQVAVKLPTMSQIARTINRTRVAGNISTPKTCAELQLTPNYTTTQKGVNFSLFDNAIDEDRLLIFGTNDNLRVLKNSTNIFCDGNFDICPPGFAQVYTIHGNNLYILNCTYSIH